MTDLPAPTPRVTVIEVSDAEPAALLARGGALGPALLRYLPSQRWFRSKTRQPRSALVRDAIDLTPAGDLWLAFVEVSFDQGEAETYVLPLAVERTTTTPERAVVGARANSGVGPTWLVDASGDPRVAETMHRLAVREVRKRAGSVKLGGVRSHASSPEPSGPASALPGEQSNSSFRIGHEFIDKLVRKLEPGVSLEVELLEHLARAPERAHVPELVGRVDATLGPGQSGTIWLSERYVENVGNAFTTTVAAVVRYYERALGADGPTLPASPAPFLPQAALDAPPRVQELFGEHLPRVELLAKRTAELHRALAHDRVNPTFRPQAPDDAFRRSLDLSLRILFERSCEKLEKAELPPLESELRSRLLPRRHDLLRRIERALTARSDAPLMRVHGDYHLGQVLDTGTDFVIVDFEGEPARSREERARRRSPLSDVAGMLRSFHYAALGVLTGELGASALDGLPQPVLVPWAALHARWSGAVFLSAYLDAMSSSGLLPTRSLALELELHLVEKALYELGYELDFRPRWVSLPLRGLLELLGD
jgi:maltose alpha-D-glucosyltransferase/alpha-amylase